MTAYVKNYSTDEEKETYQQKPRYYENVGWKREVPKPYKAREGDDNPASLERERIEFEEDQKDQQELRMFGLFAEAVEDLYTGIVDRYVRRTPAFWDEFVMRYATGEMYLVDPDYNAGFPTEPTAENLCLGVHKSLSFSPRFCLWAVERKLEQTYEKLVPGTFAEFAFRELKEYVGSRSELQDNFYKHLVINTQTRTFEDLNYVNSIGSKVVIRPLAETFELSIKKDQQLQRTMVQLDPASASQDANATGDSPPGEIPEAKEEDAAVDSPSGEMTVAEEKAEGPEYLPPRKKSRTEAEDEDVEMDAPGQPQEEPPQDYPMNVTDDVPDFGGGDLDDEQTETESVMMMRANLLVNSDVYQHFADEEEGEESSLGPRPRMTVPAKARFLRNFLRSDLREMDQLLEADRERRQRRHEEGIPFVDTEVKEEVRYGEELEERKAQDIFAQTSTAEIMAA